jgi:C1A family cysteine protease
MNKTFQKIIVAFSLFAVLPGTARFQTPSATPELLNTFQTEQKNLCTAQPISGQRTYSFRNLPRAEQKAGAYVPRTWLQKIFPFLSKTDPKYGIDDIRYMQNTLGRPIPVGVSRKTQKVGAEIEQGLLSEQKQGERKWEEWLNENPNASAIEKKQAENELRLKGLKAALLPRFDWRENGLDVGEVEFQGFDCNTCWAFATVDAMQISRRLAALRGQLKDFNNDLQPSARQLISCMVPENKYCKVNWHGAAFSFMVDKGLPLGGTDVYVGDKSGHICDAENSVRALTWDYVSAAPQKVSIREEIKKAIVTYGAVVTMLTFDRCLWLYGGGIFNEEQNRDGTHIVIILGWDDEKGWLIKNSYGPEWGENGFGWIKYETNNIGQFSAVVIPDPNEKIKPFNQSTK